ncbi:hypothetical protein ACEPPN_015430 [Leptodophora sp. 'Broadleaf-Isolate-01']
MRNKADFLSALNLTAEEGIAIHLSFSNALTKYGVDPMARQDSAENKSRVNEAIDEIFTSCEKMKGLSASMAAACNTYLRAYTSVWKKEIKRRERERESGKLSIDRSSQEPSPLTSANTTAARTPSANSLKNPTPTASSSSTNQRNVEASADAPRPSSKRPASPQSDSPSNEPVRKKATQPIFMDDGSELSFEGIDVCSDIERDPRRRTGRTSSITAAENNTNDTTSIPTPESKNLNLPSPQSSTTTSSLPKARHRATLQSSARSKPDPKRQLSALTTLPVNKEIKVVASPTPSTLLDKNATTSKTPVSWLPFGEDPIDKELTFTLGSKPVTTSCPDSSNPNGNKVRKDTLPIEGFSTQPRSSTSSTSHTNVPEQSLPFGQDPRDLDLIFWV